MHVMKFHAFYIFFGPFLGKKTDKIGQFKKIGGGGGKGRKSFNYLKIKEGRKKRRKSVNSGKV